MLTKLGFTRGLTTPSPQEVHVLAPTPNKFKGRFAHYARLLFLINQFPKEMTEEKWVAKKDEWIRQATDLASSVNRNVDHDLQNFNDLLTEAAKLKIDTVNIQKMPQWMKPPSKYSTRSRQPHPVRRVHPEDVVPGITT